MTARRLDGERRVLRQDATPQRVFDRRCDASATWRTWMSELPSRRALDPDPAPRTTSGARCAGTSTQRSRSGRAQPRSPGSSVRARAGFGIEQDVPGEQLGLAGRHRFSVYRLVFELSEVADETQLSARTYAEFPRWRGRAYRALVIGTGLHVVATKQILRSIRRAALAEASSARRLSTLASLAARPPGLRADWSRSLASLAARPPATSSMVSDVARSLLDHRGLQSLESLLDHLGLRLPSHPWSRAVTWSQIGFAA